MHVAAIVWGAVVALRERRFRCKDLCCMFGSRCACILFVMGVFVDSTVFHARARVCSCASDFQTDLWAVIFVCLV